jgi:hypothetical protein
VNTKQFAEKSYLSINRHSDQRLAGWTKMPSNLKKTPKSYKMQVNNFKMMKLLAGF